MGMVKRRLEELNDGLIERFPSVSEGVDACPICGCQFDSEPEPFWNDGKDILYKCPACELVFNEEERESARSKSIFREAERRLPS